MAAGMDHAGLAPASTAAASPAATRAATPVSNALAGAPAVPAAAAALAALASFPTVAVPTVSFPTGGVTVVPTTAKDSLREGKTVVARGPVGLALQVNGKRLQVETSPTGVRFVYLVNGDQFTLEPVKYDNDRRADVQFHLDAKMMANCFCFKFDQKSIPIDGDRVVGSDGVMTSRLKFTFRSSKTVGAEAEAAAVANPFSGCIRATWTIGNTRVVTLDEPVSAPCAAVAKAPYHPAPLSMPTWAGRSFPPSEPYSPSPALDRSSPRGAFRGFSACEAGPPGPAAAAGMGPAREVGMTTLGDVSSAEFHAAEPLKPDEIDDTMTPTVLEIWILPRPPPPPPLSFASRVPVVPLPAAAPSTA